MSSYLLALTANLCFSSATIVFAATISKTSVLWVNTYKALIATIACFFVTFFFYSFTPMPPTSVVLLYLVSGLVGLNIADMFLLGAFARIGPARSLLMYGFHPFYLGLGGYLLLNQQITWNIFAGVMLMFLCLICVSYEGYKTHGHWELKGLLMAVFGIGLDAAGVLLSRLGMDLAPEIPTIQSHLYRSIAALGGFVLYHFISPIRFRFHFQQLLKSERFWITAASFWGTFLSLFLWLTAVRNGNLGSLAAISMTGPFFAGIFEHIWKRKKPTLLYIMAFIFFVSGFMVLINSGI